MNTLDGALIRRGTPGDASALARLRLEFRGERVPMAESEQTFLARCETWMRVRLAADSAWRAWVLDRDGQLLGNIWMQVVEKIPNPANESERHAYISSFYVRPDARNVGAGSRLLGAALSECDALDVDTIFLWPSERSRALYARHGFSPGTGMLVLERR